MIAHQYKIRQQKAQEPQHTLFPIDYSQVDMNLKNTTVETVDYVTAEKIIIDYEWLGSMPGWSEYFFGIFFGNLCGGVVVYGLTTGSPVAYSRINFTGEVIQLQRGACLHWTPTGTASRLIMKSVRWLEQHTQYKIITATVDEDAGEVGTIYQACNWIYVGKLAADRQGIIIDGHTIHPKTVYDRYGTTSPTQLAQLLPRSTIATYIIPNKKRYFCFVGTKRERKYNYNKIRHLIKPYPKRAEEVSREKRRATNPEGVGQFHDSASSDCVEKQ